MTKKLIFQVIAKFLSGIILVGGLIFVPASTLDYPAAWLFMGILLIPMFLAGIVLLCKNPELLKKRLDAKEKQDEQNMVIKLSGLMFVIGFVTAGLDFRFKWTLLPFGVSLGAAVIFLLAYLMYAEVLRENVYLSRTVEIFHLSFFLHIR